MMPSNLVRKQGGEIIQKTCDVMPGLDTLMERVKTTLWVRVKQKNKEDLQ
jgi:hypothetical protein